MGLGCKRISVVEGEIRDGGVGMGDAHTGLGEFCLAAAAYDSAQSRDRSPLAGRNGGDALGYHHGSVLLRVLAVFFLRLVQMGVESSRRDRGRDDSDEDRITIAQAK